MTVRICEWNRILRNIISQRSDYERPLILAERDASSTLILSEKVNVKLLRLHLKLVDWPLLLPGVKQIYETWQMYKSLVYFHLYQ